MPLVTAEAALEFAVQAARDAAEAALEAAEAAQAPPDWTEIVALLPSSVLTLVVLAYVLTNWTSLGRLGRRISGLEALGVKIEFEAAEAELSKAVQQIGRVRLQSTVSAVRKEIRITEDDERRAIKRAAAVADVLKSRSILWVDDRPANNVHERKAFETLGLTVRFARDNPEAVEALKTSDQEFDLVISDIGRPEGAPSGLALLNDLAAAREEIPVIYYVSKLDRSKPVPLGAFGLTNRPDELLHLVVDALERLRPLR